MRIIHVRDVANVARLLVRGLSELGHEVEFRSPSESSEQRVWRKMLMAPRRLREGWRINSDIRRQEFDIVHFHYANSGWMGVMGRYPYFLHCHGSDVRSDLYHPVRRWPVLQSLRGAFGVFISTPDLYEHVAPHRPDAVFLPNPLDARIFAPLSGGKHTHARILINQALNSLKAPDVAFSAARRLKEKYENIEFYAFAHGSELERFRDYPEVQFIEPVPHARMPQVINAFDIILGQFEIGSLGVSELESMACCKPVVSWVDHARYSEWYSEPPPILAARETDAVVEATCSLIRSRGYREQLGAQGRAWVLKHHDYLDVTKRLVAHYRRFLEKA